MKILFVQESDWLKRNMHQQHHLAELMSLRGHEVKVIDYEIMHKAGLYAKREVYPDVSKIYGGAKVTVIRPSIIKLPCLDYASLMFTHYREIKRQIREFNPDVVVGFGILNGYLASRSKIPFVYYWIDVLHELIPFAPFRFVGKLVETVAVKNADKVLTINHRLKRYVEGLGALWGKRDVLGAGVDPQHFNGDVDGKKIRERYKFKDDDIVLFFMGWLYKFSGLKEVMTQIADINNRRVKLLVVGDGEARKSLLALQEKLDLSNKVYLVGRKSYKRIPHYIAASDICILPAYPEHRIMRNIVPIKVYEYMAMGKPVIATRLPAVMEEFSTDCGVVYVDTPAHIVLEAMGLVYNHRLKEMGERARHSVDSWDDITDRFENILKDVVKEKSGLSKRV